MPLRRFIRSIERILENPHVDRRRAIAKHLNWQVRRLLRLFPFEQRISNSRIIARQVGCGVSVVINSQGLYDYNNMRLVQDVLDGGGVFFDIGANIGSYTLLTSEQPMARVFAFEPHPETFAALSENVHLNARENVTLLNIALSSSAGTVLLTDEETSATNHMVADGSAAGIPVQCETAARICRTYRVVPRFVKINVEGFEEFLPQVDLLLVELNGLADVRSRGVGKVDALIRAAGLSGSLWVDYDLRRFTVEPTDAWLDGAYVSERFRQTLPDWSFPAKAPPPSRN